MYVRVTPVSTDMARLEEIRSFAEEQVIPAAQQLPGFRRYTAAIDRTRGRGVTIVEWDTLQDAQNAEPKAPLLQQLADRGIDL